MRLTETMARWLGRGGGEGVGAADGGGTPVREAKSAGYAAGTLVFAGAGEAGAWRERSYESLARSGFMQNPVVYRSVRMIAEAAAAIPFVLYERSREVVDHPLLELLRRPSPSVDGTGLIETLCGHLLLSGNAYVEAAAMDGTVRALHVLRPDRLRVIEGPDGWPQAYEYRAGRSVRRIAAEGEGDRPAPLLHIGLFHPLADVTGYAPLGAAQAALDLHNAAARWNKALLDNSARPSGALVYCNAQDHLAVGGIGRD